MTTWFVPTWGACGVIGVDVIPHGLLVGVTNMGCWWCVWCLFDLILAVVCIHYSATCLLLIVILQRAFGLIVVYI